MSDLLDSSKKSVKHSEWKVTKTHKEGNVVFTTLSPEEEEGEEKNLFCKYGAEPSATFTSDKAQASFGSRQAGRPADEQRSDPRPRLQPAAIDSIIRQVV